LALSARARVHEMFAHAFGQVEGRLNDGERREESLRITEQIRGEETWSTLSLAAENAATALAALDTRLRSAVGTAREWLGGEEPDQGVRELEIIRGRLEASLGLLEEAALRPDANRVYWFSQVSRAENLLLRAAPINVGSLLRDRVYADRRSTVFTSA